jgi:hypothetical protein
MSYVGSKSISENPNNYTNFSAANDKTKLSFSNGYNLMGSSSKL